MNSTIQQLTERGLISTPAFLPPAIVYETLMGSIAYGVSHDLSDRDVYGVCIPPREDVFPHLAGEIPGFGTPRKRFESFQNPNVEDTADDGSTILWDLSIFSIVKYIDLCMNCNPNLIDSLFTPDDCVLTQTKVGSMIRSQRHLFLHKGCWLRFKGYASSQLKKLHKRAPTGNRRKVIEEFGFDVKFAYHAVRLLEECEQILSDQTIDLRRSRELLKTIRAGNMSEQEILAWAGNKERELEATYAKSTLRDEPDKERIRQLLLDCLEEHYGSLNGCVARQVSEAIQ